MNCEKKLMEYFYSSILKPGLHKVKQPQAAGDPSLGSQHATSDPSSDMINTLKSFWALRSPKIFTSLFYWTCTAKFLVESLRFWHYQICITNSILQLSKRCIRFRLHTITISIRTAVFRIKLWIYWLFFSSTNLKTLFSVIWWIDFDCSRRNIGWKLDTSYWKGMERTARQRKWVYH